MTQRKIVSAIGMVTVCAIGLANTGLIIFAANGSSVKHQVRQFIVARECRGCYLSGANLSALVISHQSLVLVTGNSDSLRDSFVRAYLQPSFPVIL